MKKELLGVLAQSLIRIGLSSPEMKSAKELWFQKHPGIGSSYYFRKTLLFDFADDYGFEMLVSSTDPNKINIKEIKYVLKDRNTQEVLLSNVV